MFSVGALLLFYFHQIKVKHPETNVKLGLVGVFQLGMIHMHTHVGENLSSFSLRIPKREVIISFFYSNSTFGKNPPRSKRVPAVGKRWVKAKAREVETGWGEKHMITFQPILLPHSLHHLPWYYCVCKSATYNPCLKISISSRGWARPSNQQFGRIFARESITSTLHNVGLPGPHPRLIFLPWWLEVRDHTSTNYVHTTPLSWTER